MNKNYLKKLSTIGYSIIPVGEDKIPIGSWKKNQTVARTPDEIDTLDAHTYGIVTGFNNLEVIDVDLKIIVGLKDQQEWWNEYVDFLRDNIEDFDDKFVIAKTRNAGFHIIYRCKKIQGNTKIARLEHSKEAILESRGTGGYIFMYDNFHSKLEYHDVQEITERDRDILWSISKTYNYVDPTTAETPNKSEFKPTTELEISPWDDYNSKHTALDVVNDEFKIVRNTNKAYVIKRHGAESPHSGYVFKENGCMYLFSTGTQYPAEKLLSPFSLYAYRYHNGDFTKAGSQLYKDGYGSRLLKKISTKPVPIIPKEDPIIRVQFPIEIFPNEIQNYIIESSKTLGMSIDYMGSAFLWMLSVIIGNSKVIEVKSGWIEIANLWIAVVGKPGIGKTPSLNQMIFPLRELNVKEQKTYQRNYAKFMEYEKMDKKDKMYAEEIQRPISKQFLVGDITLEALVDLHESTQNSIGVFKDELAGWFKDMNKYRAGSDLEFWLSSWNGQSISLNRKTAKSAFVDKPFIPVLGGIQPSVFEEFATGTNKENGFVDRILISYPELKVNKYNNNSISPELIDWYRSFVIKFKETIETMFLRFSDFGEIIPSVAKFNDESNKEWIRIHDEITNSQNSDSENEYMKSMLPKQKSYIPRFALLLNSLWSFFDDDFRSLEINKQSILRAETLSNYYVNMAKLVKQDAKEKTDLRRVSKDANTTFDKFKTMYLANPDLNRTTVGEILEVSRQTVINWVKKIENGNA
jgi:hypothetical protein